MRFSWEWLQDHIKLDASPDEAAEKLSLRGLTVDEVIDVGGDTIFDIDITTNRPDAMNIRGIARELSAIFGIPLESVDQNYHELTKPSSGFCNVKILDADTCHRFGAKVIMNIENRETPTWMRARLERVGLRSINLLVDITNYVLWELGHPLHGYDLDLVPEGKLVVRRAYEKEKLALIDDTVRELTPEMLVIADKDRAVGLGGIMGGSETEINNRTKNILLECAWFEPINIRRTARNLGLQTEASYRFERGMDVADIPAAIDRCCHLYQKLAGAEICREMVDEYPTVHNPVTVTMKHDRLNEFAGMQISREKVAKIFGALDFSAGVKENIWKVGIPSRRIDISREADLFEEVIRIVGYDEVPPTLPHVEPEPAAPDSLHQLIERAEGVLLAAGYSEVINYDFVDPAGNDLFSPPASGEAIEVLNPIATPQMSVMRQSLAPSLMNNLRHNINRGNLGIRIFEIARVFFDGADGPFEKTMVSIAADGAAGEPFWLAEEESGEFFEIKGVIELLFTSIGVSDIIVKKGTARFLDSATSADLYRSDDKEEPGKKAEPIGWFGRVSKEILESYDLPHPVFLGQLELGVFAGKPLQENRFRRESKFPSVNRDLSFTLSAVDGKSGGISYRQILESIRSTGVEEITDVRLIDLYRGKSTSGEQSMTIRIRYQADNRTLTQDEVEGFHAKVRDSLASLGLRFR